MQFSSISGTTRGLHAGVRGRPVFAVLFWSMLCQDEPQPVALAPQRWSSQGVFGSFGKLVAPLTRSTSRIDYQTMMCFMQVATKDKEQVQNKFAFVLYQMSMWIGTLTRDPMHQFVVTPYKLRRIMVYVTQSSAGHNMAFSASAWRSSVAEGGNSSKNRLRKRLWSSNKALWRIMQWLSSMKAYESVKSHQCSSLSRSDLPMLQWVDVRLSCSKDLT